MFHANSPWLTLAIADVCQSLTGLWQLHCIPWTELPLSNLPPQFDYLFLPHDCVYSAIFIYLCFYTKKKVLNVRNTRSMHVFWFISLLFLFILKKFLRLQCQRNENEFLYFSYSILIWREKEWLIGYELNIYLKTDCHYIMTIF